MFYDGTYRSCEITPLNTELNPICYLLALLGAHHFLHVSRIRVNAVLVCHCQAVTCMNCSAATLHEMCMNIVGVMNEQVVFCLNILFLF
jgi:hypothetical protein